MGRIIIFWLSVFFVFCHSIATATTSKNFKYTKYTTKDGLPFNQVNHVLTDSDGFIWVGTRHGLSRFDGVQFENYFHDEHDTHSLSNNDISGIQEDNEGKIWCATWGGGVSVFDKTLNQFVHYKDTSNTLSAVANNTIVLLKKDAEGRMWVFDNAGGLKLITPETRKIKPLNTDDKKRTYHSFVEIAKDTFMIASWGNCYVYKLEKNNTLKTIIRKKIILIKDFYPLYDSLTLISSNDGIFEYNLRQNSFRKIHSDGSIKKIVKIDDRILLLGEKGIAQLDIANKELTWINQDYSINSFCYDKKNKLYWLGTTKGLVKVEETHSFISSLPPLSLIAAAPIDDKTMIGATKSALLIFNPDGEVSFRTSIRKINSKSIHQIDDENYLIRSKNILYFFNIKTHRLVEKRVNLNTKACYIDKSNHLIYVSNGYEILKIKFSDTKASIEERMNIADKSIDEKEVTIQKIVCDLKGNIWIATYGKGLLCYRKKTNTVESIFGNKQAFIEDILFDSTYQHAWMSSRDGLLSFDVEDGKVTNPQALIKNKWLNFIQRKDDFLWIGYHEGLIQFDLSSKDYQLFSEDNLADKSSVITSFLNEKQLFVLYGDNTFHSIDLARVPVKKEDHKLYIRSFATNIKEYKHQSKKIQLPYDENSLNISFSYQDYLQQYEHHMQVRLQPINEGWTDLGPNERTLRFASLAAGTYVLELRFKEGNGYTSVNFEILPPFWQTKIAYLIYFIIISSLLFLAFWLLKKSEARKSNIKEENVRIEEEKKYNKLRWRLFTDISHEIKTPLTLIISPLEEFLKGEKEKSLDRPTAQLVHRNAERLEELVNQLLDFRKVESNMLKLSVQKRDLVYNLNILKQSFQSLASKYEFDFLFEANKQSHEGYYDKDILERIIINLLSNAFKYTPPKEKIVLSVLIHEDSEHASISITDTGVGMDQNTQTTLFERFEGKGNVQSERFSSTGLGLSLVKELVNLHHGSIHVESTLHQGSCFKVDIPLSKSLYTSKQEQINEETEEKEVLYQKKTLHTDERLTLFLVEDNTDIQHYLKNALSELYDTHTFHNGREALEKIEEIMPDLILSDVMMPEVTGVSLCKKVKNEEKTSHIPVILLTAKGTHESKIEGLSSGADDYIAKPFRLDEVKVRIENVLQTRKKLQQKYSKELVLEGKTIQKDSMDEQFIQKAMDIVHLHLQDSNFGVEMFSKEIGYSKSQLYNKIKALTSMTTNEFIKVIRLKKAAHLIKQKSVNIGEVSFLVGFSSNTYFSTSFKEMYGMTPRQYQKQHSV